MTGPGCGQEPQIQARSSTRVAEKQVLVPPPATSQEEGMEGRAGARAQTSQYEIQMFLGGSSPLHQVLPENEL